MVEATLSLCSCPIERTGQVLQSLDLLDERGLTVMTGQTIAINGGSTTS
jgi:hypothetical protein